MNLTLSLWLSLLGRRTTEAVLLVALATAAQRFVTSARARGTLWQAVLLGVALVWVAELGGVRSQVARWWPQPRVARHLVVTLPGEPVSNLSIVDGFDAAAEPAFPEAVVKTSRPVWWPLQLWLAGFTALLFRATALRCWLGFTASRRARVTDTGLLDRVENLRRRVGLRRVRVLAWPGLRSPIAFGTLRPTIALPADFAERFCHGAQEAMLAHELAHLAAGDPFWLALADAVLAFAWWHPAVWWARRQLRAASEATADEASALVPGGRVALAESLVTFGRELAAPGWTRGLGVAGDGLKSQLARRVTALLRPAGEWRAVRPARLWLARGVTLAATLTLMGLPWPGAGGPALAKVVLAAAASSGLAGSTPEGTGGGVDRTNSPGKPSPAQAASQRPPLMVREIVYGTEPAERISLLSTNATDDWTKPAHFSYGQPLTRSSSLTNLNLWELPEGGRIIALPDGQPQSPRQEYQDGPPKRRKTSILPDDWKQPAHSVYVALRTDEPAGEPPPPPAIARPSEPPGPAADAGATPAGGPELQQRYRQAMMAAKEADVGAVPIRAKYGAESAEFAQATERYQKAKEKVAVLKAIIDADKELEDLRAHYRERHPKVVVAQAARAGLLAKLEGLSREETNAPTQLFTRQFKLGGEQLPGITEHFRRLLPPGETNLQVAIHIFCATNGVEMPPFRAVTPFSPMQEQKAVFFNDRTGVLFVRATLDDLDQIEHALQTLIIPTAEAEEIRSGTATQLRASNARLAELRAHYKDRHPKVLEELAYNAELQAKQRNFELNGRKSGTNAAPAGASANTSRQIVLEIQFAEVVERGSDDVGLDWIFGRSPTNNPVLQSGPATNLLTEPGSPHGEGLRVDLLRTVGESAILAADQFAALRKRLESRSGVEFLAAPKVITQSGREALVAVSEQKTIVSGREKLPATATNKAEIAYLTEQVAVGPKVDIIPILEGVNTRLGITATVTEFLGYDQPAAASAGKAAKGALQGAEPLPHLRVRVMRADSISRPGETVALRGPLVADTKLLKDKVPVLGDVPLMGRLFRSESKSTVRKRLYVFVTPTEVTTTGERMVEVRAVPAK